MGVGAFQDGLYDIAEKQFSLFLGIFQPMERSTMFHICWRKTFLLQEKWKEAKAIFSKMIQENKSVDSMDYALFWMAQTEMKIGESRI